MKILWVSNAPWATTGYGVQANSLLPRLMAMPEVEDIGIFAYYGIVGAKTKQEVGVPTVTKKYRMTCYPVRSEMWGNDVIQDHAGDFQADIVITLMDIWVLNDNYGQRGFRWLPYMPIDADPPPPPVISKMRYAYLPIVYSKFAKQRCDALGLEVAYIPHGVETRIYKPYMRAYDRRESKKILSMPGDAFVVGCVGANKAYPPRKGFPELMEAFAQFRRKHSDVRLYMHSLMTTEMGGPDLREMADAYGILNYTNFVDPYKLSIGIDTETMNLIYNAMDVFCLPSRGEGFGVPLIEAQAAGTPVIATNYTSMPELVGAGWTVDYDHRDYTSLKSWQVIPRVGDILDALEEAYKADRTKLSVQAREFAMQYDWDSVVETGWKPLMQRLNCEITPRVYKQCQA